MLLVPILKLSGERAITAIAIFHLVLGGATAGLTALAARRWGLSRWRVIAAAWIVAIDPVLAWQSRFIMTETLTAFLCAAALAALPRPYWRGSVLGGVLLGLASLSRPSMLPGAVLVVLAGLLFKPGGLRDRLARCATMSLTLILVLSPWAIRNALIFGEPVWTTTHGGYTLALANNEVYYRDVLNGPPGGVWTGHDQWIWWNSIDRDTTGMSEPQADRFLRNRVVDLAISRPVTFLCACLQRLRRFWSLAPAGAVYSPMVRWGRPSGRFRSGSPWCWALAAERLGAGPRSPHPFSSLASAWFTRSSGPISGCALPSCRQSRLIAACAAWPSTLWARERQPAGYGGAVAVTMPPAQR